jgi:hypothetical protein
MKQVAANYFSANNMLSPNLVLVVEPPQFSYDRGNNDLIVSVPARLETTFLKIVDINEIRFTVSSKVARPQWGPLELALVLDRTWSMNERLDGTPKYQTLQTAATKLVESVMDNPNASVGVVPFATYLRVAGNNPVTNLPYVDEAWLKKPNLRPTPTSVCNYRWKSNCTTPSYACEKDGVASTCQGPETCTSYGPIDCSSTMMTLYYNGCFMSRTASLTSIANPTNPKYYGLHGSCQQTPILDLTNKADFGGSGRSLVKSRIAEMVPVNDDLVQDTYIGGGLEFGWHMLEPGQPLEKTTSAAQASRLGLKKVIVLMTDGANTVVPSGDGYWDFDIPNDYRNPKPTERANTATQTLCTNIKNAGIEIFTVAFSVNSPQTEQLLRDCASAPSYFFSARSSSDLLRAFERIGASLQALRVKQ